MVHIVHGEIFDGEVDLSGLIPPKKQPSKSSPPARVTELGSRIEEVRKACGLLHIEMSKALSDELGVPVGPQTLAKWVAGAEPRKFTPERLYLALDRIEDRLRTEAGVTWVAKDEVGKQVREWLETMSVGELAQRIDVSPQLVSTWSKGQHAVLARRWVEVLKKMAG